MSALDVITLDQAKVYLVMEGINDRDDEIERLIKTAIAWIERYTCYRLYPRDEEVITTSYKTEINYFPINSKSIKLENGSDYTPIDFVTYKNGSLALFVHCPLQSTILLNTGYEEVEDIPEPLISAAYKIITYLFENKDAYSVNFPVDIQLLINQYRRSASI